MVVQFHLRDARTSADGPRRAARPLRAGQPAGRAALLLPRARQASLRRARPRHRRLPPARSATSRSAASSATARSARCTAPRSCTATPARSACSDRAARRPERARRRGGAGEDRGSPRSRRSARRRRCTRRAHAAPLWARSVTHAARAATRHRSRDGKPLASDLPLRTASRQRGTTRARLDRGN